MNSKLTLGLLAAAVAAVGYLVWFDRDRPGTQAAGAAERKVLPAGNKFGRIAPIDRIEIAGPNGRIVLALDAARVWRVIAPMADRANPAVLRELVETLDTSLKFDTVPATPADLERFGLRVPEIQIKIFRAAEAPVELQLGAGTAVDGRIYARLADAPNVMVIPEAIQTLARRSSDEFRDPRLFNMRPADIVRVTVRNEWGNFELQRDRGRWELTRPVAARADDKAVNDWLERLCESQALTFPPGGAGELLSFGLMVPRGSVRLDLESATGETPRSFEIRLGHRADPRFAPDATYVQLPDRGVVVAAPFLIEESLLLEPDALREHTLFTLNPDLVDRIRLRPTVGDEILLARQGDGWTMLRPAPMAVEASEVTRLMKIVPGARVREFLAGAASKSARAEIDPPALRVTFASFTSENTAESAAGETPIATLAFGRTRPDESLLVRVEEDNVIARVDAEILAKIPTEPIAWQPLAIFDPRPSILSMRIEESNEARSYERTGNFWKQLGEASARESATIESAAALLSGLRAVRWLGPVQPTHGLDAPTLIVRANSATPGGGFELKVGRRTSEGMWPAIVTGRNGVFLLSDPDRQTIAALAH